MRPGLVRDGGILTTLGLCFIVFGDVGFGVFEACIENAACYPHAGALNVGMFLELLALGIALTVAGVTGLVAGFLLAPRNSATQAGASASSPVKAAASRATRASPRPWDWSSGRSLSTWTTSRGRS